MKQYIDMLISTEEQYKQLEEKNYYLVHKYNDILKKIPKDKIESLKMQIFKYFNPREYDSFLEYVNAYAGEDTINKNLVVQKCKIKTNDFNIMDFYENFDYELLKFIKGHLFLEFAIDLIIKKKLGKQKMNWKFYDKINYAYTNQLISNDIKIILIEINKIRNKIAHNLLYQLDFNELYNIVKMSWNAGVDYSEHTIWKNKKLCYEWYGIAGIINEMFPNIFSFIIYQHEILFTEGEITKLIL